MECITYISGVYLYDVEKLGYMYVRSFDPEICILDTVIREINATVLIML